MSESYQAAWLCYLNGLEIPVEASTVDFGVWQMPTATISLTPHPIIQRIGSEDRIQVVLFFLDEFNDPANPEFRLWGEYEITGWQYMSEQASRTLDFTCVSQVQIFKQMYFSQLGAYKDTTVRKYVDGAQIGGNDEGTGGAVTLSKESVFVDDWEKKPPPPDVSDFWDADGHFTNVTHKRSFIKRPIDLVLHIFKAILSPVYAKAPEKDKKEDKRKFVETEDPRGTPKDKLGNTQTSVISKNFFARWMKMTGFHKRWFALPLFEDDVTEGGCFPIIKETGGYGALRSLQKHAGRRKGSAWDMFLKIYTKMYMELAMSPVPAVAVMQKKTGKVIGTEFTDRKNQFRGLMTFYVKPQCLFSLPPMCNVMFPSLVSRFQIQEPYMAQPTRIKIKGGHGSNLSRQLMAGTDAVYRSILKQILNTGYPSIVYKRSMAYEKSPGANDENYLIFPEEMFKGPVVKRMSPPPWMRLMQKRMGGVKEPKSKSDQFLSKHGVTQTAPEDFESKSSDATIGEEVTTVAPTTESNIASTKEVKTAKNIRSLFQKYAEYEFFRARYELRNSSVSLLFQPFIVPGFPGVVFDQRASGLDNIGYVTGVSHSYSRANATVGTSVSLAFVRTLQEDARDKIREPISSIRKVLQDNDNASEFYKSLLFRKEDVSKATVFIREDVVEIDEETHGTVRPTPEYKDAFENYATAIRAVARPGCSLREYAEVYHNKDIDTLLEEGTVQGENRSFYSVTRDATPDKAYGGAVFWERIYKLKQGAGPHPDAKVTNIQDDEDESPSPEGFTPVDDTHGDMPQTRYDWDTVLEEYRKILYTELAPQE